MTPAQPEPRHFDYIDAVRGLAFLAVLTFHCALCVGNFPLSDACKAGEYGVQLFFLASAITLCHSMSVRSHRDGSPLLFFYIRRFFRIAPLYWLAMIFYWTLPAVIPAFWLGQWAPNGVSPSYFIWNALFLHGWRPNAFNSIVPGGWSIGVEMMFYLLFPFLFTLLNSLRRAAVALLIALTILPSVEYRSLVALRGHLFPGVNDGVFLFYSQHWFGAQFAVFLIGIFAYHLLKRPETTALAKSRFWSVAIFLAALLVLKALIQKDPSSPSLTGLVIAMAVIVITISRSSVPLVVNPVIRYIGRISYSCYLVHFAAVGVALRLFRIQLTQLHPYQDTGHPIHNLVLFLEILGVALPITIAVSTITLRLVENPGIALGKRLIKRIASQRDAPACPIPAAASEAARAGE